jgi:hypothetical protein
MNSANPLWVHPHPRRAIEGRYRDQSGDRRQVHGATSRNAFTDLAHVSAQLGLGHRRYRHVRRGVRVVLLYLMVILGHDRRKIVRFDVIQHPTAEWQSQQITEALPWDTAPPFLLRDRDALVFSKRVDAMGIAEVVTAPGSSWQNAYVERVSARSAESVWTTSSSSTSAICVASVHRTWITTTDSDTSLPGLGLPGTAADTDAQGPEYHRHPSSRRAALSIPAPRGVTFSH